MSLGRLSRWVPLPRLGWACMVVCLMVGTLPQDPPKNVIHRMGCVFVSRPDDESAAYDGELVLRWTGAISGAPVEPRGSLCLGVQ